MLAKIENELATAQPEEKNSMGLVF